MSPREMYLDAIGRDGAAFRASAAAAGMDAPVASCPGWTVADLVWHLGTVHYFWAMIVEVGASSHDQVPRLDRLPDDELLAMYDANLARLLAILERADPATAVWTWAADHSVAFVVRRMAQETAVHRWDADTANGTPEPIDAALASDGIDEFLHHFLEDIAEGADPVAGSVHIHCLDVAGEWTIRPEPDGEGYDVTREHAKGDCALRGAASDLLLALWRRVGADALDVVGDANVAARFLASTNLQ